MNVTGAGEERETIGQRAYSPAPDLAARLTNVDLNLLPALLALLQASGVTAAGDRIGLSQPAMSHALSRLRLLLGDPLLVRTGNRTELTPRARELQDVVAGVLSQVSDLVIRVHDGQLTKRDPRFTLTIAPAAAVIVTPLVLEALAESKPGFSLSIIDGPRAGEDLFLDPQVDMAIITGDDPTRYERTWLFSDQWAAVVSADNTEVGDRLTIQDLSRLPHIGLPQAADSREFESSLRSAGVVPRYDAIGSTSLLVPQMVVGTKRVAIVPRRAAAEFARYLPIRTLDLPFESPPFHVHVVQNPSSKHRDIDHYVDALQRRIR